MAGKSHTLEGVVSPVSLDQHYRDKNVLVTGHTGFKGAWLCEWLLGLGAEVAGFSLEPPTTPSLFDQLGLSSRMNHQIGHFAKRGVAARNFACLS